MAGLARSEAAPEAGAHLLNMLNEGLTMTPMVRRLLRPASAVALCTTVLATCKDSSGPPEQRVTAVEVVSGNEQQGTVATALAQPLVVQALDAQGRPVRGARVEWQLAEANGSITPVAETTDRDGRASANWTLGTIAGGQSGTVRVGTTSGTFQATATAGPVASLNVTPSPVLLDAIGATASLQFAALDAHGNPVQGRTAAWATTDAAVVSVTDAGQIAAVSSGTARVTATVDGVTGETEVMVQQLPTSIVLDPPNAQLGAVGATVQFQAVARDRLGSPVTVAAQDFAWSSSNPQAVSVSASGLATAQAVGVALIRAALGDITGQAQVTVSQVAVSLVVAPRLDTLTTAKPTVQLVVTATDANNQPIPQPSVTWNTSNAAIATVSATGIVTAVANGTARIRATSGTASDSATIVVRLNAAPKALPDTIAVVKDVQRNVAAPGVLANDTLGIPAGVLTTFGGGSLGGNVASNGAGSTVTFGTGGSLRVNADGSLTFMPSAGFTGNFTFQYRVQNAAGSSDAVVTLRVGEPPAAVDDAYQTQAGVPISIAAPGVLANDVGGFPAGVVASFGGTALAGTVTSFAAGQIVAFGIGGSVRLNANGSMSFTPPTGFTGDFTFQYRLSNGMLFSDANITVTVTAAP